MTRAMVLAAMITVLSTSPLWATAVFGPQVPHNAPPAASAANEGATRGLLNAQCKIREALGKTSASEANELLQQAATELSHAADDFGRVARNIDPKTPLNVPDTSESKDARSILSGQGYPAPERFGALFTTLQTSVQNEMKEVQMAKFSGDQQGDVGIAIRVNNAKSRTDAIYDAVSVLTTLAKV